VSVAWDAPAVVYAVVLQVEGRKWFTVMLSKMTKQLQIAAAAAVTSTISA